MKITLILTAGSLLFFSAAAFAGQDAIPTSKDVTHGNTTTHYELRPNNQYTPDYSDGDAELVRFTLKTAEDIKSAEALHQRFLAAQQFISQHDSLLADQDIDDDATIIAFLKTRGYKNPSSINIDLVRQYLSNHHLLHVADIP